MTLARLAGPIVQPLDGRGCNVLDVGGKAAGLDRLAAHGFPIPGSVSVTAEAYRWFVRDSHLDEWLERLASQPLPEPDALDATINLIEGRFLEASMPEDLALAIGQLVAALLDRGPVAVRSSATAEDLGIASFAGQYRTYVRILDIDGVFRAIRLCWASLWLPAAQAYRRRHEIPADELAMGVVVQEMVEADWSGVGFTRDPAGTRDVLRVEMVPGLGEALVSGRITPDDFTIRRDTLSIHGKQDAAPPMFLEDLGRMLLQVEDQFDEPQDVEWAYTEDGITLLQSRPITVSGPTAALDDGFDEPRTATDTFTPRGVVEMLPGVVSPLLWTINAPMLENAFREVVASLGSFTIDARRPFVGRFRGRAALNLSALQELAEAMPGGSAAEVERQFLGRVISSESDEHAGRPGLGSMLRARRAQRRIDEEVELSCGAVAGILDLDVDLVRLPARHLIRYRSSVRDLAWRLYAAEVAASSAGAAAYRGLEILLQRWMTDVEAAEWAQRLTAGALAEDAVGVARARSLRNAYDAAVAAHPGVRKALLGEPTARSRDRLLQLGTVGVDFVTEVERLTRSQGSRSLYGGPTWDEDPTWVWEQLAVIAANPARIPAADRAAELEALMNHISTRKWMVLRVLTGQITDLRKRWLRHQIEEAGHYLALRERAKAALLSLGGEERRIIQEGRRRLAASRQMSAEDVELSSDHEFAAMLLGMAPPSDTELFRRMAVRRRCLEADPLPEVFTGTPDAVPHLDVPESAVLHGWAASPGVAEGAARVLGSLAEGGRVKPGDVVVARTTDPSWTPLLLVAGGLVLEEGGPLSHGAIVAREFGVPAVLNVPGATRIVQEGEVVEVDGFGGVVRRIAPDEEEEAS